jgi:predicted metal-dependent hydrolase
VKAHLYPEQELKRRAMRWAVRLKVNPRALRFEELRDRWGYCSPAGEVTLALDLVDKDERFQDYVIVHELLHLRVRSHGKRFWALLSAYVPDWRDLDKPDPERGGCEVRRPERGKHRGASAEQMPGAETAHEE